MEEEAFFLDGEPVSCAPLETGTAKMDLNLEAYKTKNGYSFRLEYATSLYYRDSMELLSRCFCAVVEELIKGQEKTLYELPAVSFRDRLELLERPNRMHTPYLKLCVDQAVESNGGADPRGSGYPLPRRGDNLRGVEKEVRRLGRPASAVRRPKGRLYRLIRPPG